jgi:hypothetical protein
MYSSDKDLNKEIKKLIDNGWIPIKKKRGHWQIRSPGGTVLTIAGSVSDFRTIIKFRSDASRVIRKETLSLS